MPQPNANKAYSYLRFSSPEQGKGASRQRQIEAAEAWAAANGLRLDEELRDEGISAFRGRNRHPTSALGGFLSRVDKGEIKPGSYLLIESFDRLSRQEVLDALELFLGLTRKGITIVTLADGYVWNRETMRENQLQLVISIVIMTRAFEESATKSRRVGDAWSRKRVAARERRQAMTATCPGWIRLVGGPRTGRYELIEDRATLVRGIFEDTIAGDGRRTIAKRLNAAGVEPWGVGNNKGEYWHDSYVQKILMSPAAFGRYERGDETIEGYFPAVVDEATFWRARAASADRHFGQGRPIQRFANLLHGLAACRECGGSMAYVDKGKKSGPRLQCSRAFGRAGCGNREAVPYGNIDFILAYSYAHFADAAVFAIRDDAREAAEALGALEEQRKDALIRRDRLFALVESGTPIDAVRSRLDALTAEIDGIVRSIREVKVRSEREADEADDIEARFDIARGMIAHEDAAEELRGRTRFNSRLRHFLEKVVVSPGPKLEFEFKPEYANVSAHMASIYSPRDEAPSSGEGVGQVEQMASFRRPRKKACAGTGSQELLILSDRRSAS